MALVLFPPLGETDITAHEFQTQKRSPFPKTLYVGPIAELQSTQVTGLVSQPSQALMNQLPEPWRSLMYGIQRKGNFIPITGSVGTTPILARAAEERTYVIIQNTSAANQLFVGVGYQPVNTGAGVTGLILAANGGNFEPGVIPQQDIWLLGSAANTLFVMYVAQG